MCLYPRLIDNPKYRANKKNGGVIPAVSDNRVKLVPIGCGDCIECRKQKSREWQVRLLEDLRHNNNGIFVALTFRTEDYIELYEEVKKDSNLDGYDLDNQIAKKAVRRFLERWRKKHKRSIRHWLITELGHGETEHIHLHGILWIEPKYYIKESKNETIKDQQQNIIAQYWKYGAVWVGEYVNEKTVNYMTKYVTKIDQEHKYYKAIILTSPGIGRGYTNRYDFENNKYNGDKTKEYYKTRNGYKVGLPIYYRNKIYTEDEREKLWLHKLDEEKRYVLNQEIDISIGEDEYWKALKTARAINRELGYGSGELDWNRKNYERQKRNLIQKKRIEDAKAKEIENAIKWGGGRL